MKKKGQGRDDGTKQVANVENMSRMFNGGDCEDQMLERNMMEREGMHGFAHTSHVGSKEKGRAQDEATLAGHIDNNASLNYCTLLWGFWQGSLVEGLGC